jgi:hypothetical protein
MPYCQSSVVLDGIMLELFPELAFNERCDWLCLVSLIFIEQSFLFAFYAMCWSIWKHRNNIVFNSSTITYIRNLICLIISLMNYSVGGFSIALVRKMKMWLLENLEVIRLQVMTTVLQLTMDSEDNHSV